ncbi:MAG: hypothetical protein ICV83_19705 [Cytophagales bacterium]|nr:hypothetical protein [Cytophagales bacterium]
MENLIVIVLKTEFAAAEAYRELLQLDREDHIDLLEAVIVARDRHGRLSTRESSGNTLTETFAGTLAGELAEAPGDRHPCESGASFREMRDAYRVEVSKAYLADLAHLIGPGTVAVVAHVLEERTLRLDRRLTRYAASLLRIPL